MSLTTEQYMAIIEDLHSRREYNRCARVLDLLLAENTKDGTLDKAYCLRAALYVKTKQFDKAVELFSAISLPERLAQLKDVIYDMEPVSLLTLHPYCVCVVDYVRAIVGQKKCAYDHLVDMLYVCSVMTRKLCGDDDDNDDHYLVAISSAEEQHLIRKLHPDFLFLITLHEKLAKDAEDPYFFQEHKLVYLKVLMATQPLPQHPDRATVYNSMSTYISFVLSCHAIKRGETWMQRQRDFCCPADDPVQAARGGAIGKCVVGNCHVDNEYKICKN
jgi:hypothetical protein